MTRARLHTKKVSAGCALDSWQTVVDGSSQKIIKILLEYSMMGMILSPLSGECPGFDPASMGYVPASLS